MGDYGFKVKSPSFAGNVESATVQQLAASSAFNCFSIAIESTTTVVVPPSNSGVATTTIAHGLNFTPTALAFCECMPGKYFGTTLGNLPINNQVDFSFYADNNNLYLQVLVNGTSTMYASGATFNVKYFIFGDTARESSTHTLLPSASDYGIKVMKPLVDASSKYVEDIIWSSRFPPMKIAKINSTTMSPLPTIGNQTIISVAHGLSYAPAHLVYRDNGGGTWEIMPHFTQPNGEKALCWTDSTNLYISENNFSGGGGGSTSITYKYMIFAEKAAAT